MKLYNYQNKILDAIESGKHLVKADCSCLAKGTPILMADKTTKAIEDIKEGDKVWSHDDNGNWVVNEVDYVFRDSLNPKPMIQLEYDGETIRTTYDHPFFNGEGYYPLYQLIWGALETSQRVQLQLLCKQYGKAFNNKALWCKHSSSNEASVGRMWLLQDTDEWQDSQATQSGSTDMVRQPYRLAMCKSYQWRQDRQPNRELRVVYYQVQRLVDVSTGDTQATNIQQEQDVHTGRPQESERVRAGEYSGERQKDSASNVPKTTRNVSASKAGYFEEMGELRPTVSEAEPYYTLGLRKAPYTYCIGQRHSYLVHNSGKTLTSLMWAKSTGKPKVLVVTTASVRDSEGFEREMSKFCDVFDSWYISLSSFSVVSWSGLNKWLKANWSSLNEWAVIFDEIQRGKAGISSNQGKAMLQICKRTDCWTGWTATPGDKWEDYYAYFTATGNTRNKTDFRNRFCVMQNYPFPKLLAKKNEDEYMQIKDAIWHEVDSSEMADELPETIHQTIKFKQPVGYKQLMKTHELDGEFLDNASALAHAARRLCGSKQKLDWLADFVEGLDGSVLVFYSYETEREAIEKALKGKVGKIWNINGKEHDVPTEETIGKHDVVLAQWQAGAFGLNLQFMNCWVSFSPSYSYTISEQARKRIHRKGQTKICKYWYLICENTIDEDVYVCLKDKKEFDEELWGKKKLG